jgi:hypothetical protein
MRAYVSHPEQKITVEKTVDARKLAGRRDSYVTIGWQFWNVAPFLGKGQGEQRRGSVRVVTMAVCENSSS